MKAFLFLSIFFLSACGIESASDSSDKFSFTLNASCTVGGDASGCLEANTKMNGRAYGVLTPCSSLFGTDASSTEISSAIDLSFTNSSAIVNCTASSCQATFNSWTTYDPKGSITFFVVFDSDKDGVFGEVGEPYACEDAIDYEAGVLDVISESSADLGYDDIQ